MNPGKQKLKQKEKLNYLHSLAVITETGGRDKNLRAK